MPDEAGRRDGAGGDGGRPAEDVGTDRGDGSDSGAGRGGAAHGTPNLTPAFMNGVFGHKCTGGLVPWWGLTLICAALGFALAEWLGAVVAGTLGFFAWKLR